GMASFGFIAKSDGVHFNYVNHVSGLHVVGLVTDVKVIAINTNGTPKTVRFSGTCSTGPACTFSVTVEDNGEPGTIDKFGIAVVTGGAGEMRTLRTISTGNIQFHN
ncbi:MAG TPA: post-COAP-1 domain-containing protein, partial [Nitrospiria bacterium]|nr:post-COAP-1 domain-containing protein [Nitrospiria bacterium]